MKKVTTAILGLSLLVGSASFAQDSFIVKNDALAALYPIENNDSPDYLQDNYNLEKQTNISNIVVKSEISNDVLTVLYPAENNDSPSYLEENNSIQNQSNIVFTPQKSTISNIVISELYRES